MENKKETPKKSGDSTKSILIGIIVLLLGSVGYLIFNGQQQAEKITVHVKQHADDSLTIAKKINDLDELTKHFETLKAEREALGLSVDSLQNKILELEHLRDQLKKRNITLAAVNAKLTDAQASYIHMKSSYDSLIASNKYLSTMKDSLVSVNTVQKDSLSKLSVKNAEYEQKVAIASILRAENYKIVVLTQKGKEEKSKDAYKAKSVGKIKFNFTLADNAIAKQGEKEIYFKLIEPSGATIFEGEKTFIVNGRESTYTDKQSINFTNTKQLVTFLYNKGSVYKPGKYTIELFSEGHKIGDTYLTLK